jgi:hypothetical protein
VLGREQGVVQNAVTGFVEPTEFNEHVFSEQYHTFMRHGYARAPDTGNLVGDQEAIARLRGTHAALFGVFVLFCLG